MMWYFFEVQSERYKVQGAILSFLPCTFYPAPFTLNLFS